MDPVSALAEVGGFATRRTLLRAGVTRRVLTEAVAVGRVVRLQRGVYGIGLPDGVHRLEAATVALRGVASHDTAALLWGMELAHPAGQHVTVPRNRSRAAFAGTQVHRADVNETEVRGGVAVTSAVRTVVDCAATLPVGDAVVVADSAIRKGLVARHELVAAAETLRGPHVARVRLAVSLTDAKSESVLESLLRVLLVLAGLPPDETQHVIRDGGVYVGRVDLVYLRARLVVEADGFEFHRERADYRSDRRKMNAFCRGDWSVLRFSWEDVRLYPDYVVAAVRYELAKTPRRRRRVRGSTNTQKAA